MDVGKRAGKAFTELKSQPASVRVVAYFSEKTEARDARGFFSGVTNNHEPKANR